MSEKNIELAELGVELGRLEKSILDGQEQLKTRLETAEGKLSETGELSAEAKAAIEAQVEALNKVHDRLEQVEAKMSEPMDGGDPDAPKSFGTQFSESDAYKALAGGAKHGRIEVEQKAITNAAYDNNQPLVQTQRLPGVVRPEDRRFTVRDFLPVGSTVSNNIEYAKELLFTNGADYQLNEGDLKAESDLTFELANSPVVTIAHWILASKQVLADAPMLRSYIDSRLMYGLKLKEEQELLNGTGAAGMLHGLIPQAVTYPGVAGHSRADQIRRAMHVVELSEYAPTVIAMHPTDWMEIELARNGDGDYYLGGPAQRATPILWGQPVITTQALNPGQYMTGAFQMAAQIWDREQAAIEISTEDRDNFVRNMCTILAEERLTLTVYRPTSFVEGTFV